MIPDREPDMCWPLRKTQEFPVVQTAPNEMVDVLYTNGFNIQGQQIVLTLSLSRLDARLLARRLNACLDETRRG